MILKKYIRYFQPKTLGKRVCLNQFYVGVVMNKLLPDIVLDKSNVIAVFAILISIITWWMDYSGLVYECPYCRTQRTVIGVLGILLLLPFIHHWLVKLIALQVGGFGFVVASIQHFRGWNKIWANEFKLNATVWTDPTILSSFGMFIIIFLIILVLHQPKKLIHNN